MDEETWLSLKRDIEDQVSRGIRSRIVMPDWNSFKEKVEESEYELDNSLEEESFVMWYNSDVYFKVRQSLFHDYYKVGDISNGYGFKELECIECGCPMDKLLYDSEEEVWYCSHC